MKCHYCEEPATVHLTDFVKPTKQKRELHLCEGCARKHNLLPEGPGPQLNLQALVTLLMGQPLPPGDPAALTCPSCGLKYAVFRADGRLGCPNDYEAFRPALEPLLERIHRVARHAGKAPRRAGNLRRRATELAALRDELAAAVAAEDYEAAARLRDRIREREGSDEPG